MFARRAAMAAILTALPHLAHPAWAVPIFQPIIQEVLYDVPGPDTPSVFTELVAPAHFDLHGWSLVGVNGSSGDPYRVVDLTGAIVPGDGILVIATAAATLELAGTRDFIGSVDWQNGPDAVQLRNPFDEIIDALQYGDAGPGNAGEGAPAADVPPGVALSRDDASTDTGDNARDFRERPPTPGRVRAEPQPIPEPGTWVLLLFGSVLLTRAGRHERARSRRGVIPKG